MPKVIGFDSSTQSFSAILMDTAKGEIVAQESVNFGKDLPHFGAPSGYMPGGESGEIHADPLMWLEALDLLLERMKKSGVEFSDVVALSGSGQQHGSVYLNESFFEKVVALDAGETLARQLALCLTRKTSPIWMDSSTSHQCAEIAAMIGGDNEVCRRTGSIMIERFTGSQIRRFFQTDPVAYEKTAVIHLVSSFLASVMAGASAGIDRGDGAGMNLMNLEAGDWDAKMVTATAPDLARKLPPVVASDSVVGLISNYFVEKFGFSPDCKVVAWTGDNPSSLVGMGATEPGKMVVSLGTSDTLFAAMEKPLTDPQGFGHVFGNPAGGFMSLICFKNGSLAREAVKNHRGLDWADFGVEGLQKTLAGNEGKLMLSFFAPEITPRVESEGATYQPPAAMWSAEEEVRGVLEGQFLNMRLHAEWLGVKPEVILLTGGASLNDGVAQTVANIFKTPVARLEVAGSACLGAGMRAAVTVRAAEMVDLVANFAAPSKGGGLLPDLALAQTYDDMLEKYREFLRESYPQLTA